MKDYILTEADLYVGAKLICLNVGCGRPFTVGRKYEVIVRHVADGHHHVANDEWYGAYTARDLHCSSLYLYPYDKMADKEKFIYELSGRLPE